MDKMALIHQVYETYGEALYRFCRLQMKHPADAEEAGLDPTDADGPEKQQSCR